MNSCLNRTTVEKFIADRKKIDSVKLRPIVASAIPAIHKDKIGLRRTVKNFSGALALFIPVYSIINGKRRIHVRGQRILNFRGPNSCSFAFFSLSNT